MNILRIVIISMFLVTNHAIGQKRIVKLWDNPIDSNGLTGAEIIENNRISNVSEAELWIYKANEDYNNRKAVIICPGGGYIRLAIDHEGEDFAKWLNSKGITAIVLKYRMPNGHKMVPLHDGQEAIRYVRKHADELDIDPSKIGIAGFSAGGHLASMVSTHFTTEGISSRPDFSILYYPVISMGQFAHTGSLKQLLGTNMTEEDILYFSTDKQVTTNTPETIMFTSYDDKTVGVENSLNYYQALIKNKVDASLYIFPEGGHGWGMRTSFKYHDEMLSLLGKWLESIE